MSPIGKIRISVFLLGILICLLVASVNGQPAGGNGDGDAQPPAGGNGDGDAQPPAGGNGDGDAQPPAGGNGDGDAQPPAGGNGDGEAQPPAGGNGDGDAQPPNGQQAGEDSDEDDGSNSEEQQGRQRGKKSGNFGDIFERSSDGPRFCQQKACPKFTVDYELRNYDKTKWLTVNKPGGFLEKFRILKKYLNGGNAENRKVKIGVPVLKEYVGDNTQLKRMLFYTSETNLPPPTDDAVKIVPISSGGRYIKVFGGFATPEVIVNKKTQLVSKITGGYDTGSYYAAIFNSPFQKKNRHNEIWVIAKQSIV